MKKILFAYYLMVVLTFGTTAILTAESITFVAEDENSSVIETGNYESDYFWGGYKIDFSGSADDLYLMGRNIEFRGESEGALTAFGDTIAIDGLVKGNLHTAGSDVRITGHLGHTSFAAGQDITIAEDAVVDGTFISGSNTLQILGRLNDGLLAGAGEIIIDAPVKGDVNVRTGKLIITERGSIDGNLVYGSNTKISASEESRVTGTVTFEEKKDIDEKKISRFCIIVSVLFFLGLGVTGILFLLFPGIRYLVGRDRTEASYGKAVLWGLIPLFIYPVAIVFAIPLFPLAIALLLAAFPFWLVTTILGLTLSGQLIFKLFKWENNSRMLQFLLAFAAFLLLMLVPFLDFLIGLALSALGAGLLLERLFKTEF